MRQLYFISQNRGILIHRIPKIHELRKVLNSTGETRKGEIPGSSELGFKPNQYHTLHHTLIHCQSQYFFGINDIHSPLRRLHRQLLLRPLGHRRVFSSSASSFIFSSFFQRVRFPLFFDDKNLFVFCVTTEFRTWSSYTFGTSTYHLSYSYFLTHFSFRKSIYSISLFTSFKYFSVVIVSRYANSIKDGEYVLWQHTLVFDNIRALLKIDAHVSIYTYL